MYIVLSFFTHSFQGLVRFLSRFFTQQPPADPSFLPHEQEVVQLAQQGNHQAFTQLYEHYFPQIYRFIMRRSGHEQVTEDLTSQVFLKAFKNMNEYRIQGHTFGAWLYRIAANTIMDHYRKASTRSEQTTDTLPDIVDASPQPDDELVREQDRQEMLQLVERLSEKEQRIVTLKFFAELSVKEIAKVVALSPNTVSVCLFRALKKLRRYAEQMEAES